MVVLDEIDTCIMRTGHRMDLLYFSESKEIASLGGLTSWCPETIVHKDAQFLWLEDNDLPLSCRHNLFSGHRDIVEQV